MKKLILALVLVVAFSAAFVSCRDTKKVDESEVVDDMQDAIDDTMDAIDDTMDDAINDTIVVDTLNIN